MRRARFAGNSRKIHGSFKPHRLDLLRRKPAAWQRLWLIFRLPKTAHSLAGVLSAKRSGAVVGAVGQPVELIDFADGRKNRVVERCRS